MPIDPVAFEAAAVWPVKLAVAAFGVLVVDHGVVALLGTEARLAVRSRT